MRTPDHDRHATRPSATRCVGYLAIYLQVAVGSLSAADPPPRGASAPPQVKVRALRPTSPAPVVPPRRELRPEEMVALLGHDSFDIRQRAAAALSRLGSKAKPALLSGLKSDDAEVRSRCRQVLAIVLEIDHQEQLEAFTADRDGQEKHDLPGWERFQRMVGDDRGARLLFAEMQRYEPYLLEAAEDAPDALDSMFLDRCQQIQRGMVDPDPRARQHASLGTVAALFFVASDSKLDVSDEMISYLHNFSYQTAFQQAMQQSTKRNDAFALRKLLGAWVGRDSTTNGYQNFMLALRYDLDESLPPALATLQRAEAPSPVVQYALLITGRFGSQAQLPLVEAHLDSTQICGVYQDGAEQHPMLLGDLALAVAIHLAGQDHEAFGFPTLRRNRQMLFVLNTVGFRGAEQREAALAKWHAWRHPAIGQ